MEQPPIKPPRGVKPVKETSGLLMSVIRTLSASETNEQRDREKAKLESEFKICDRKLDELVSKHEGDLMKVTQIFSTLSQQVNESREKIQRVKNNLKNAKTLLHCRRDELKTLWYEGLEHKYMLQLLEKIEKINDVPNQLSGYLSRKHYLHATELLVQAVSLGKETLDGVESLKELSRELEQKKEQLHLQLLVELKRHLYTKASQQVITFWRQGSSNKDVFSSGVSHLQRSNELRLSARQRNAAKKNLLEIPRFESKTDEFVVIEDLEVVDPETDSAHFVAILVKCLALLEKLPLAVNEIRSEMQNSLMQIVYRTTQHVNDFRNFQNEDNGGGEGKQQLVELVQMLFEQFKAVAQMQSILLKYFAKAQKAHNVKLELYDMNFYWTQVQNILKLLLNDYLDIPNTSTEPQLTSGFSDSSDISSYFSRRKQPNKKKPLFKFDGSSSAINSEANLAVTTLRFRNKLLCTPDPNNITYIFIPFMSFADTIENTMNMEQGAPCILRQFLADHVLNVFLKRKSNEIMEQIDAAIRAADAWKATVLLDSTTDYKPILVSTLTVEKCIRHWHTLLKALPLYSEKVAEYACAALKDYKDTCYAAYQGIVQPHSEDRKICSAAWLNDADISRFLKSLPNWLNLKTQQELQMRSERRRTTVKRDQPSEEESPEDVRQRNRREAEMLASNLGEGGVSASEILSDMSLLKELAQLQESMEWFAVRMFEFTSEFRQEPLMASPTVNGVAVDATPPISAATLQQLTSVAQDFDELANTCLLLLHLEVRVQCFHYLLAQSHFSKETHEPDPKVLELSRVLAGVDEAMTSSLHPRKCKYIFEGLGHLIAKILISSTQYMQVIDEAGIQRICRNIFALQQTLTNITMTREVALDHARHYFELFFLTSEEILNGIVEKGPQFSELEYMNAFQLLHRSQKKTNPSAVNAYLERLSDILGEVGVTV